MKNIITFDEEQYAAYRADNNVAVSAGAGSGKTTVLAERYVRLVTEGGFAISEVLTLTFTRKAAAEMYSRIFKRLSQSEHPLAKERLTQFDQARISTLDAFCSTITRGVSYRYGISGDFRIDERSLELAAQDTAVEIIMRHRYDTAIGTLVAARNFETIVKDLFAALALSVFSFVDADLTLPVFEGSEEKTYAALGKKQLVYIEEKTGVCVEEVNGIRDYILDLTDEYGKEPASLIKIKDSLRAKPRLEALYDREHVESFVDAAEHYLDGITLRGKLLDEVKEAIGEMRDALKVLRILAVSLLFRDDLPVLGSILDEYRTLFLDRKRQTGLLSFTDTAELAVHALKTDTNLRSYYKQYVRAIMIDEFQDNNNLQKDLLYLLAERDDCGTAGIMPEAKDLAPDKLFFVGDEKQSIYRFRGADVAVFNGLSDELAKVPEVGRTVSDTDDRFFTNEKMSDTTGNVSSITPKVYDIIGTKSDTGQVSGANRIVSDTDSEVSDTAKVLRTGRAESDTQNVSDIQPELSIRRAALSLSTNYRSTAELVAFFNALFPGVFGEARKPYEAKFSAMLTKKEKHEGVDAVEVYIQEVQRTAAVSDDDTDDEHEQSGKEAGEALAAARRIIDGVKAKQFAFGDIAVLFKSTAHQNEYEKTFRLAGIPFSAADPRGLYCEGPANDMYAILRLALFPMDRNAYATVLRSPFVKLGDESVFRIMLEKPETPFPERYPEKWFPNPAEKARYLHGSDVFNELLAMVDLRGIAPVLAYLWYESGYRSYLLYDPQSRDLLEHFEYLYAMAMDADKRQLSMSAFLDELAPLMGTTEKAATGNIPEQSDTVLFLTVHKSKGLEFPVVIIANAGVEDTTVQKEKQKPYYLDPHWGVTLNLKQDTQPRDKDTVVNSFFDLGDTGKKLVQDMSEAELKRLFYVAATRAEQRLFIFGSRTVTKDEDKALDGMDGEERLAALIRMRRVVGKDEDQRFKQKSFLDLFSLGAAEAKLPPFKLVPCTVPTTDGYTQETARLHEAVSALLSEQEQASLTEERLTVEQFYRIPARVEPRSRRVTTTPTLMEAYNRALHPEHYMRGNKLDDFACERFLLVEDKRIIPINESVELLEETAHSTETMRLAFGKLCHHIIETFLSGVIASDDEAALQVYAEEAVRTLFPESARDHSGAFAKEALIVGRRFMASATGRDAAAAKNRRAEYPFLLPLRDEAGCVLVRGAIDLIYEHEGHCVIIDFKTDKQFNPATHTVQLACYARAAAAFSSLPVKTALVYLREQDLVAHEFAPDMNDAELVALTCVSAL